MNKRNVAERFDFARRIDINPDILNDVEQTECEVAQTPKDSLLSIIYATDERTGLPTGDIQYFVSDRASDDVKNFILQNLMIDVSSAKNVANPSGLSDDALLELSRGSRETVQEYAMRLGKQIGDFKFLQEQIAREQAEKQNVSDKSE